MVLTSHPVWKGHQAGQGSRKRWVLRLKSALKLKGQEWYLHIHQNRPLQHLCSRRLKIWTGAQVISRGLTSEPPAVGKHGPPESAGPKGISGGTERRSSDEGHDSDALEQRCPETWICCKEQRITSKVDLFDFNFTLGVIGETRPFWKRHPEVSENCLRWKS